MFDFDNAEANSEEFDEFVALMNECVEIDVRREQGEKSADEMRLELEQTADTLEYAFKDDLTDVEELIECLRYTAEKNPLSETAYDLRTEAHPFLLKVR